MLITGLILGSFTCDLQSLAPQQILQPSQSFVGQRATTENLFSPNTSAQADPSAVGGDGNSASAAPAAAPVANASRYRTFSLCRRKAKQPPVVKDASFTSQTYSQQAHADRPRSKTSPRLKPQAAGPSDTSGRPPSDSILKAESDTAGRSKPRSNKASD